MGCGVSKTQVSVPPRSPIVAISKPVDADSSQTTLTKPEVVAPLVVPPKEDVHGPDFDGFATDPNTKFADFDEEVRSFMTFAGIPGGSWAVCRDGRLVHQQAYGVVDLPNKISAQPDTMFRTAGLSKIIHTAAVLRLAMSKPPDVFSLDLPIHRFLKEANCWPNDLKDSRALQITVRHCLQGSTGMTVPVSDADYQRFLNLADGIKSDRYASKPAVFHSEANHFARIMTVLFGSSPHLKPPLRINQFLCWLIAQPLSHDPGAMVDADNDLSLFFAVPVIVQVVSGTPYQDFVRRHVFEPLGITRPHLRRNTIYQERQKRRPDYDIVYYADHPDPFSHQLVEVEVETPVESFGWVASTLDICRLVCVLFDPLSPFLTTQLRLEMFGGQSLPCPVTPELKLSDEFVCGFQQPAPATTSARPPQQQQPAQLYNCGWWYTQSRHFSPLMSTVLACGTRPGSVSLVCRTTSDLVVCFLFNRRPSDLNVAQLLCALYVQLPQIETWPQGDQFPGYLERAEGPFAITPPLIFDKDYTLSYFKSCISHEHLEVVRIAFDKIWLAALPTKYQPPLLSWKFVREYLLSDLLKGLQRLVDASYPDVFHPLMLIQGSLADLPSDDPTDVSRQIRTALPTFFALLTNNNVSSSSASADTSSSSSSNSSSSSAMNSRKQSRELAVKVLLKLISRLSTGTGSLADSIISTNCLPSLFSVARSCSSILNGASTEDNLELLGDLLGVIQACAAVPQGKEEIGRVFLNDLFLLIHPSSKQVPAIIAAAANTITACLHGHEVNILRCIEIKGLTTMVQLLRSSTNEPVVLGILNVISECSENKKCAEALLDTEYCNSTLDMMSETHPYARVRELAARVNARIKSVLFAPKKSENV